MPADPPTILINGTPNLAREYESFMQGIELFSSISIFVNQETEQANTDDDLDNDVDDNNNNRGGKNLNENSINNNNNDDDDDMTLMAMNNVPPSIAKLVGEHKLDSCIIKVYPPLNPDHEYFRLPNQMMLNLNIRNRETKDGIIIYGKCDLDDTNNQLFPSLFVSMNDQLLGNSFILFCSVTIFTLSRLDLYINVSA